MGFWKTFTTHLAKYLALAVVAIGLMAGAWYGSSWYLSYKTQQAKEAVHKRIEGVKGAASERLERATEAARDAAAKTRKAAGDGTDAAAQRIKSWRDRWRSTPPTAKEAPEPAKKE